MRPPSAFTHKMCQIWQILDPFLSFSPCCCVLWKPDSHLLSSSWWNPPRLHRTNTFHSTVIKTSSDCDSQTDLATRFPYSLLLLQTRKDLKSLTGEDEHAGEHDRQVRSYLDPVHQTLSRRLWIKHKVSEQKSQNLNVFDPFLVSIFH